MILDPLYIVLILPAILLSLYAQFKVKSAYRHYSKIAVSRGITGSQIAYQMLTYSGINDVDIEMHQGFLSDHYDPSKKVLRLSPGVFKGNSIASAGIAAHEAGHAIQHKEGYFPLKLRTIIVPAASLGSKLSWFLLMGGFLFGSLGLIKIGILFFATVVFFQIVTLPVEFNASSRAISALRSQGMLNENELQGTARVLNAAALTYIAAATMALLQLLYFLLRAGLLGSRD